LNHFNFLNVFYINHCWFHSITLILSDFSLHQLLWFNFIIWLKLSLYIWLSFVFWTSFFTFYINHLLSLYYDKNVLIFWTLYIKHYWLNHFNFLNVFYITNSWLGSIILSLFNFSLHQFSFLGFSLHFTSIIVYSIVICFWTYLFTFYINHLLIWYFDLSFPNLLNFSYIPLLIESIFTVSLHKPLLIWLN